MTFPNNISHEILASFEKEICQLLMISLQSLKRGVKAKVCLEISYVIHQFYTSWF